MASRKGKAQFYVFYLGWKECRGVRGREFVEPIVRELISRRLNEELPKLTIEATRKELKIMQLIEKRKGKIEKLKYPPIPTKDVTYAVQALSPDEDVVACIYLGYNPQTHAAVHVHVYRCDSSATASFFVDHLMSFITLPENQERTNKIEGELIAKNQVYPSPSSYAVAAAETNSSRYDAETQEDLYSQQPDMYPQQPDRYEYSNRDNMRYQERDHRGGGGGGGSHMPEYQYVPPKEPDVNRMPEYQYAPPKPQKQQHHHQEDPYTLQNFRRDLKDRQQESTRHNGTQASHAAPQNSVFMPKKETVDHYHEQEDVYQSVTAELKAKLQGRGGETAPILLPAKDYDTVGRTVGNLDGIAERRSRNKNIIGSAGSETHSNDDQGTDGYNEPHREVSYQKWRENRNSPDRDYRGRRQSPDDDHHPYGHPARAASPEPRRGYGDDNRRGRLGRSPPRGESSRDSRMARALSPPPGHELRNTYFPNNESLPNYLDPKSDYGYAARAVSPGRRGPSPSRRALSPGRRAASPLRSKYSSGSDEGSRRTGSKYTPASLGLKHGAPLPRGQGYGRPRSDEGYLSMDRDNPYRGSSNSHDDRHAPGGHSRNNDTPPPRQVVAGQAPHREMGQEVDPNLPGSNQSFLY